MKKKHLREIQRISKTIPKELLDTLMKEEYVAPEIRAMVIDVINNPEKTKHIVTPEKLKQLKAMFASGELDQKQMVVDTDVEKQIDTYLNAEFEKARKLGRLPPPQKMPSLKSKVKKHVQIQTTKIEGGSSKE